MSMKIVDILIQAKALIEKPENWTTGEYARDKNGSKIDPLSAYATCFCSQGALRKVLNFNKVTDNPQFNQANYCLKDANVFIDNVNYDQTTHEFNDSHTHEQIMSWWDKAIELAKQRKI